MVSPPYTESAYKHLKVYTTVDFDPLKAIYKNPVVQPVIRVLKWVERWITPIPIKIHAWSDIAKSTGIQEGTVYNIVKSLQKQGLIEVDFKTKIVKTQNHLEISETSLITNNIINKDFKINKKELSNQNHLEISEIYFDATEDTMKIRDLSTAVKNLEAIPTAYNIIKLFSECMTKRLGRPYKANPQNNHTLSTAIGITKDCKKHKITPEKFIHFCFNYPLVDKTAPIYLANLRNPWYWEAYFSRKELFVLKARERTDEEIIEHDLCVFKMMMKSPYWKQQGEEQLKKELNRTKYWTIGDIQ